MDNFPKKIQEALKKTQQKKYEAAINEFTAIINEIHGDSEDETKFKFQSLLGRATCNLNLLNHEQLIADTNAIISQYENKKFENQEIAELVAFAHLRLGQHYEATDKFANALTEYSYSKKFLSNNKEFDQIFKDFLKHVGIPQFAGIDKELKLFSDLIDKVTEPQQVLEQLLLIKKEIQENPITEAISSRLQSRNVYNIILAYFKLFSVNPIISPNDQIISELSDLGQILYSYDVDDWSIVHTLVLTLREASPFVFGKMCNVLKLSTEQGFRKCIDYGLLNALIQGADYKLTGAEAESYQLLCGFACVTPEATLEIGRSKIIDYMYSEPQIATIMSIARITFLPEATMFLEDPTKTDFVFELLKFDDLPVQAITAACIIFGRSMIKYNEETKESISYDKRTDLTDADKQHATKILEALEPIISKNTKSEEICANAFMAVAYAARGAPEIALKLNLHRTASVIIALHKMDPHCALNCSSFLLNLIECGHIDELKVIQALPQNVRAITSFHSAIPNIVEIGTCILLALKDNGAEELATAALKLIPDSEMIKKYLEFNKK